MIDIGKLLPQADNSLITERSVKKLGVVERKLNLIDSLLKEKLVLSKVRQGIEREEQERIRRTQTEIDLEKDDDDDDDMDDGQKDKRKKKDPKPSPNDTGGLLGLFFSSAALRLLTGNASFIVASTERLTLAITGILGGLFALSPAVKFLGTLQKSVAKAIGPKAITTLLRLGQVFKNFLTLSVIAGVANSKGLLEDIATRGQRKKIARSRLENIKRIRAEKLELEKSNILNRKKIIKRTLRLRQERLKLKKESSNLAEILIESTEGATDTSKKITKKFTKSTKKNLIEALGGKSTDIVEVGSEVGEKVTKKTTKRAVEVTIGKGGKNVLLGNILERAGLSRDIMKRTPETNMLTPKIDTASNRLLGPDFDPDDVDILGGKTFKTKKSPADIKAEKLKKQLADKKLRDEIAQRKLKQIQAQEIMGRQFDIDFGGGDSGMGTGIDFPDQSQTVKQTKKITAETLEKTGKRKGFKAILESIGGIPLVKSTRKLFNNTLGRIPFIGDIIGLLVDIFIFKEPLGRAAFMAVGGGLGGLLGGIVGSALPGPGTFVGGLLGGIAGDFLGGLLYDLLIGGEKPKVDVKERGVRAGTRLLSPSAMDIFNNVMRAQFSGGGSVPMLAMNGGGSPDIASFASYDNPRNKLVVRFVPIPTSKGASNSQEGDAIIIKQQVGQPRLIRSLYTGGA